MLSTCVAVPDIGARTMVWSRLRWASSSAALACAYSGNFSSGRSALPSNWLKVDSRCCLVNCACNCAVTSPADGGVDVGLRAGLRLRTAWLLRSTSRCLSATFFCARSASVVERAERALGLVVIAARGRELGLRLLRRASR